MMTFRSRMTRAGLALTLVTAALAPLALAQQTAQADTSNAAPAIGALYLYESDPTSGSGATCKATGRVTSSAPSVGSTRTLYVCAEITDANGWSDACETGSTRTFDVRDYNNSVVSDETHDKDDVALACATGSGTAVAAIAGIQMEYWRPAGTADNTYPYKLVADIQDVAASTATLSVNFDWTSATSLDVSSVGTINLGSALAPGAQASQTSVNLYNDGNLPFTLQIAGTAFTGSSKSQSIAVGNLKFATTNAIAYGSKTAVTGSAASTGLGVPVDTSDTPLAAPLYLQLGVPAGSGQWVPADTYSGTVTFTAG